MRPLTAARQAEIDASWQGVVDQLNAGLPAAYRPAAKGPAPAARPIARPLATNEANQVWRHLVAKLNAAQSGVAGFLIPVAADA